MPRAAGAGDDVGEVDEVGAGGGVGVLQVVKRVRIAPWRFRSRRRRGGGAGSNGRRAGPATAPAAGAIALQSAAFWHAGPSGR